jgi:hypothetical protein
MSKKLSQICEKLIQRYERSKRNDQAEPKWVLHPYSIAYDYMKSGLDGLREYYGDEKSSTLVEYATNDLTGLDIEDGTVYESFPFPARVIHDGFKVGTTSWVFMGRRNSNVEVLTTPKNSIYGGEDIYVVSRIIPPEINKKLKKKHPELEPVVYCGYSLNDKIKVDIGPCITSDEVADVVGGNYSITIKSF